MQSGLDNMTVILVWSLLILLANFQTSSCAICTNTFFGKNDPSREDDLSDSTRTGLTIIMSERDFIIDCCGVVDRWEVNVKDFVSTTTFDMQIWRPTTGGFYQLVGENSLTVNSNGPESTNVNVNERITVLPGDKFGWYSSDAAVVGYDDGGEKEKDDNWLILIGDTSVGGIEELSKADVENDRTYGIRVDVMKNTDPRFPNLPDETTIYNDEPAGVSLIQLTIDDIDTDDLSTLTVWTTSTANTQFSFDTSTLIVSTGVITSYGSVEYLRYRVSDQCDNTATATYTVTILNRPPTIHNMPDTGSLREDVVAETLLFTINVTDSINKVTCFLAPSVSSTYPFSVRLIPGTTDYGIYNDASPGFDYSTKSFYTLEVECNDGADSDLGDFTVFLIQNSPPVILNLQNYTRLSVNVTVGTAAFNVISMDPEEDDLTYTMTCVPVGCPFQIFASGMIEVTDDLSTYNQVAYDVYVTVSDGRSTDGPKTLTIDITDINYPVVITNLPTTRAVIENTPLATSIIQVLYQDYDWSQTKTFSRTSSPTDGALYFSIDSNTGVIFTDGAILNYEGGIPSSFTLSVTVTDDDAWDARDLVVNIIDQNEAPYFDPDLYSITANEGNAGDSVGTPVFNIIDEDISDSHTFSMNCGTSNAHFYMKSVTGEVLYQVNYDLDTGLFAAYVTCDVKVTDKGGLKANATLSINIENINDHNPFFIPTFYTFYVSPYSGLGTVVGLTTASDADSGTFGTLSYRLDQSSLGDEYFAINSSGAISISGSVNYSTSYTFKAIVMDGGGKEATSTVTVVVRPTTTAPTTTQAYAYKDFWDEPLNWAWFIPMCLILIAAACVTCWVAMTCHGEKGCSSVLAKLCRRHKHKFTLPERQAGGTSFDTWRGGRGQAGPERSVRKAPPSKDAQAWRTQRY